MGRPLLLLLLHWMCCVFVQVPMAFYKSRLTSLSLFFSQHFFFFVFFFFFGVSRLWLCHCVCRSSTRASTSTTSLSLQSIIFLFAAEHCWATLFPCPFPFAKGCPRMNITIIALVASALTREREEKGDQTPCLLRIPAQTDWDWDSRISPQYIIYRSAIFLSLSPSLGFDF